MCTKEDGWRRGVNKGLSYPSCKVSGSREQLFGQARQGRSAADSDELGTLLGRGGNRTDRGGQG